ncbi:MAG TPA: roadblock/LC7 domain-containing protein [Gemmatimonadaceae bacterium]|nr:roadblock/LC7 domain-containing protein [Gemmatimonadaceae bacterium]
MSAFQEIVERLQRHHGVNGVMLVGMEDGMVIAGDAGAGRDADTAAALAAMIYRKTRIAAEQAGFGAPRFMRLEADGGNVCATSSGDVMIVAMAARNTNLGRLRLEMLNATGAL